MARWFLLILIIAAAPVQADDLRFPALADYIETMQTSAAKDAELDEFFFIGQLTGDFVEDCSEPDDQAGDGILWRLRYVAAMNQSNDIMMSSRWLLLPFWEVGMPDRIPEVIDRTSRDLDSEWRSLHAAHDMLAAATDCRTQFAAIEKFDEAYRAFERKSQPYHTRMRMEWSIATGATSSGTPDPADMRRWRETAFELADAEAITDYAVAVFAGRAEPVSRNWALGEGSKNRLLLIGHPDSDIAEVRQIASALASIEGPFAIRPAADPTAFGIAPGEFKGFFSGQEFDGTGSLATVDKMVTAFEAVAEWWRDAFYAPQ